MLNLDPFKSGDNLHSRFGPVQTLLCLLGGYLISHFVTRWLAQVQGIWYLLLSLLLVAVIGGLCLSVFMGSLALRNRGTQLCYSGAIGLVLAEIFTRSYHQKEWWICLAVGAVLAYLGLHHGSKKPSLLAAGQCLAGTLAGIWLLSFFVNYLRLLYSW